MLVGACFDPFRLALREVARAAGGERAQQDPGGFDRHRGDPQHLRRGLPEREEAVVLEEHLRGRAVVLDMHEQPLAHRESKRHSWIDVRDEERVRSADDNLIREERAARERLRVVGAEDRVDGGRVRVPDEAGAAATVSARAWRPASTEGRSAEAPAKQAKSRPESFWSEPGGSSSSSSTASIRISTNEPDVADPSEVPLALSRKRSGSSTVEVFPSARMV